MINLSNSNLSFYPYPHILFKNIFDNNFYENLCLEYPDVNNLVKTEDKNSNNLSKFNKYHLNNIDNKKKFENVLQNRDYFKKIYHHLASKNFFHMINSKLIENNIDLKLNYFKKKFFFKTIKHKFYFEFSSIPCDGGHILPHTDSPKKKITCVIPIIKTTEKKISEIDKIGTSLLVATDDKYKFNFHNRTVPFNATKEEKYIEFLPNQMFMFIKTYNSLHSVGPIKDKEKIYNYRKSLTITFIEQ